MAVSMPRRLKGSEGRGRAGLGAHLVLPSRICSVGGREREMLRGVVVRLPN
jgi:hypothetical protein